MNIADAFKKFTRTKKTKYGYQVGCRKGLFGVSAPTKDRATSEAWHYFAQYYRDGEYSE